VRPLDQAVVGFRRGGAALGNYQGNN
jgi:hypothetical protein